jgi:hypothetical protein
MPKTTKKPAQKTRKAETPHCPFCDAELMAMKLPVCQACHVEIVYCADCGKPLPKTAKQCPSCGKKIKIS